MCYLCTVLWKIYAHFEFNSKSLNMDMFTTVLHHLFCKQHSVSVCELRRQSVVVLEAQCSSKISPPKSSILLPELQHFVSGIIFLFWSVVLERTQSPRTRQHFWILCCFLFHLHVRVLTVAFITVATKCRYILRNWSLWGMSTCARVFVYCFSWQQEALLLLKWQGVL